MGLAILIVVLWVVAAFLFLAVIYGASIGDQSYPKEKEEEIEDKEE
jgi:hypothetical protein